MVIKTEYKEIKPYTTKDSSIIRELLHPDIHGNKNQSLAEAIVPVGSETILHKHKISEEIYCIIEGIGLMTLEDEVFNVNEGGTLFIPPGAKHRIKNTGNSPLKILCCCSPPYSHDDTELLS